MNVDKIRARWDTWIKVGGIALVGLVVSPIIIATIQGIVGLIIAGAIGFIAVTVAPIISMKAANFRVRGIVSEAKENPIETMTNLLIAKKAAYKEFKVQVENAITAVNQFAVKCKQFSEKYPNRATEFDSQLKQMRSLVERKKESLKQAATAIEDGENKLEECKAYYDMAIAAQAANKAANLDTGDVFEKLKADTAIDSVMENMSRAFAELEVAASEDLMIESKSGNGSVTLTIDTSSKVVA